MTLVETLSLAVALAAAFGTLFYLNRAVAVAVPLLLSVLSMALMLSPTVVVGFGVAALAQWALPRWITLPSLPRKADKLRRWLQLALVVSWAAVALQFALHVRSLVDLDNYVTRPELVDAFLPVAAVIQLKAWLQSGYWDTVHPVGAIALLLVLALSLLVKRSFCGWGCPLNWLGEQLYQLRRRFLRFRQPKWFSAAPARQIWLGRVATAVDMLLRGLKYYLLYRLFDGILMGMPSMMVIRYLQGMYHAAADLKMWAMFLQPSLTTTLALVAILLVASLRRHGFCRYLCPIGAASAIVGAASPFKMRRDRSLCIRNSKGMACDKCSRACPAGITVHQRITIHSDECNSCQSCVAACPKRGALATSLPGHRLKLDSPTLLLIVLTVLFVVPLLLIAMGLWQSDSEPMMRFMLWRNLDNLPMF